MEIQNIKYWKTDASAVTLGSVGFKNESGPASFDMQEIPDLSNIIITNTIQLDSKSQKTLKAAFEANVEEAIRKEYKIDIDEKIDAKLIENAKFYIFTIESPGELLRQIIADDNAYRILKQSKQARIITAVVKVYSHESSSKIGADSTFKLNYQNKAGGLNVSVGPEFKIGTLKNININDGATVAFLWRYACWDKEKKEISGTLADKHGEKDSCFEGYTDDPLEIF